MTAIATCLLGAVKQYAQSLKKQLDISVSNAQTLTAHCHGFADWHEVRAVASSNPLDPRLRAAALSRRSDAAVTTPAAVHIAAQATRRMSSLTGRPEVACVVADHAARGFTERDEINPSYHLDFAASTSALGATALAQSARFQMNLFDPLPRFVAICGATGWGKSALGVGIACAHARTGGNVCILDPFAGQGRDWAAVKRDALLRTEDAGLQMANADTPLKAFKRITAVGYAGPHAGPRTSRPPLKLVLRDVAEYLLPLSVLVIDEPMFFGDAFGEGDGVAYEIERILASGSAVVWLSQEMPWRLSVNPWVRDRATLILGRIYASAGLSDDQVALVKMSQLLDRKQGRSSDWIAAVASPGHPSAAHHFTMAFDELEALIGSVVPDEATSYVLPK